MFIRKFINGPLQFVKVFDRFSGVRKIHSNNHVVRSSVWDYVKNKFGFPHQPKNEKEVTPRYRDESYMQESEKEFSRYDELYKPGYRGRTDNKRF